MHSRGKGISASALPYKRTPPSWLKISSQDMWASLTSSGVQILCLRAFTVLHSRIRPFNLMESRQNPTGRNPSFISSARSNTSGGGGGGGGVRGLEIKDNRERLRGRGGGGRGGGRGLEIKENWEKSRGRGGGGGGGSSGKDKIDALGRLLTRILRHMASELKLDMRSDGYVRVQDLLELNLKTFANIPLRSYNTDDIKEAVRRDNKQRFSLLEENGELLIRANQGHTIATVETESLLKPILSPEEVPVCVHGTYRKNLESILKQGLKRMKRLHVHFSCGLPTDGEVISGMRRDINVLIFFDVRKALEEGMKLYISDNRVILTEGFDGVVPVKYFQRIESWPNRDNIPF